MACLAGNGVACVAERLGTVWTRHLWPSCTSEVEVARSDCSQNRPLVRAVARLDPDSPWLRAPRRVSCAGLPMRMDAPSAWRPVQPIPPTTSVVASLLFYRLRFGRRNRAERDADRLNGAIRRTRAPKPTFEQPALAAWEFQPNAGAASRPYVFSGPCAYFYKVALYLRT